MLFFLNNCYNREPRLPVFISHADGEPPTADRLGVSLVEVRQNLFEGSAVEWFCDLPLPFSPFAIVAPPALGFFYIVAHKREKRTPYIEN